MTSFAAEVWTVLLELSPWLLLGAAVSATLHLVVPRSMMRKHLQGRGAVAKAVLFGVPLPLCSCGVIPAGIGLKKEGASDGASLGFIIATPQTGVDSILVSASMLGWPFALFKVVSAGIMGLVGGGISALFPDSPPLSGEASADARVPRTFSAWWAHFNEVLQPIWGWVVVGVLVSALISMAVPEELFTSYLGGIVASSLVALLLSLPMYICATASVPIAAALVAKGMPLAAALVFLVAGPATNLGTMGAIGKTFGRRNLGIYLGTIVVLSLAFAALGNSFLEAPASIFESHVHGASWIATISGVAVVVMLAGYAFADLRMALSRGSTSSEALRLEVSGMTCGGCERRVHDALVGLSDATGVMVEREAGRASVDGGVNPEEALHALESAGYPAKVVAS